MKAILPFQFHRLCAPAHLSRSFFLSDSKRIFLGKNSRIGPFMFSAAAVYSELRIRHFRDAGRSAISHEGGPGLR